MGDLLGYVPRDCHMTACRDPLDVVLQPTIWPCSFMAVGLLHMPPSVGSSTITPFVQTTARQKPSVVRALPMICPRSLRATARLPSPSGGPRSVMCPFAHRNA